MAYCNIKEKENKHIGNTYHSDAVQDVLGIKNKIENPLHTLPVQNESVASERWKKYSNILQAIARVIHLLGKQDLALRGHQEDISDISSNSENPGNCLTSLQQIALCNPISAKHSSQQKCYFFRSCRKMN